MALWGCPCQLAGCRDVQAAPPIDKGVASNTMAGCEWQLIYWPTFPGRGDFVRLMFEEAGVAYDDVCRIEDSHLAVLAFYQPPEPGVVAPVFAPPTIRKGEFVLSQTAAILQYLGRLFGLYPSGGAEEEARAMQLTLTVMDYVSEGIDAFHPIKKTGTYDSQKDEAEKFIEAFKKDRLPKFLGHLESWLSSGEDSFFVGANISFTDIAVFHALRATEAQFGADYYSEQLYPKLKAFQNRLKARPGIEAFLKSDRSIAFCGNSMM